MTTLHSLSSFGPYRPVQQPLLLGNPTDRRDRDATILNLFKNTGLAMQLQLGVWEFSKKNKTPSEIKNLANEKTIEFLAKLRKSLIQIKLGPSIGENVASFKETIQNFKDHFLTILTHKQCELLEGIEKNVENWKNDQVGLYLGLEAFVKLLKEFSSDYEMNPNKQDVASLFPSVFINATNGMDLESCTARLSKDSDLNELRECIDRQSMDRLTNLIKNFEGNKDDILLYAILKGDAEAIDILENNYKLYSTSII